ncbi:hypothetical protein ACSNOI_43295, partial [Actinomadura kijaniata]
GQPRAAQRTARQRRSAPHAADAMLFEEAEPVLAPRRRGKAKSGEDPLPELIEEETPCPTPEARTEPEPEPAPEPEPEPAPGPEERLRPLPPPRESGRTENRGGAIYVLRDEPPRD